MAHVDQAVEAFIERHVAARQGERKGRLRRGNRYAENLFLRNVWWPLFGQFDHLHPEYEVYDWNRKSQFIDFAFMPPYGRFGIEVDGFQTHVKDMDRETHSYSLNRDTFLTGLGWTMLHFSFDDVQKHPEISRMLLQLAVGTDSLRPLALTSEISHMEKDILRMAWRLGRHIRPRDVREQFGLDFRTARKHLASMCDKGLLRPVSCGGAVRRYELEPDSLKRLL
ncbi:hypothetical protein [Cohnella massiliensis]|uniref:hypothetical protein n=1 Tax=Cohnella massiliensis TaxID=1816691 RepID=UPI0009BB3F43|nr:hypothetical protein [Cohnella massiliensis]